MTLPTLPRLLERGADLDLSFTRLVDEVVQALAADRGTLYLVDGRTGELFSKAAQLPELREIRLPLDRGIAGAAARTCAPQNVPLAARDPRFDKSFDARTGYVTRSVLAAPILDRDGAAIGVLQVLNKRGGRAFSPRDERRLVELARELAEALAKTSLYPARRVSARRASGPLDYRYNFIVGTSTAMRQVYALLDKAAATSATVLLQGETGTGKGLIARAIHLNSARAAAPFVTVDCTALPPSLIESELFGHERGAFTGAERARPGKFELAQGGTVFIDELGELPLALQAKLLRVIQERELERVGGTASIRVDLRVIAATHRDLAEMVDAGAFREDLYYRIRVLPIVLPPLRERGAEDVERLARHFLELFASKHKKSLTGFTAAAMRRLVEHSWPGNIRELENCVESAAVLSDGRLVDAQHLSLPARALSRRGDDLSRTLAEAERDYARAVLHACGGNRSEAARRLDISRNTLARLLRR